MNECEMCKNIKNPIEDWDKPIFKSSNFVSFPSVGALVPGYMLVLPRQCELSMAQIKTRFVPELIEFTYKVAFHVQKCFGPNVVIYEHGPKACHIVDDSCSACIDHAHFHVVPIPNIPLKTHVFDKLPKSTTILPTTMSRLQLYSLHNYLYLEYPLGHGWVFINERFPSQLIRGVIAELIGIPDEFNWRKHPQFDNLTKTILRFDGYLGDLGLSSL